MSFSSFENLLCQVDLLFVILNLTSVAQTNNGTNVCIPVFQKWVQHFVPHAAARIMSLSIVREIAAYMHTYICSKAAIAQISQICFVTCSISM